MSDFDQLVVEAVVERLAAVIGAREPGHCLRIDDVPAAIADQACKRLYAAFPSPDRVLLVQMQPQRDWHAHPTKVVEYRNELDHRDAGEVGRLAVFVPAGARMAAEDSFGASTFELVALGDIYEQVLRRELQRETHPEDRRGIVETVLGEARRSGGSDSEREARYAVEVLQDSAPDAVGRKLPLLGLLPDLDLHATEDGVRARRLHQNAQQVELLTELVPPAERIRRLPLDVRKNDEHKEIAAALLEALRDGTVDPLLLTQRVADRSTDVVDFARWQLEAQTPIVNEFRITSLVGDFAKERDNLVTKSTASIGVKFRCDPAPSKILGLHELRLECLKLSPGLEDDIETGVRATKNKRSLPKNTAPQWKMRVGVGDREGGLEDGHYRFRLSAITEDGFELTSDLSDVWQVGEIEEATSVSVVHSLTIESALAEARKQGATLPAIEDHSLSIESDGASSSASSRLASAVVRLDGISKAWRVPISRLLLQIETWTIEDSDSLGRYEVDLATGEIGVPPLPDVTLPQEFLEARRDLFDEVKKHQISIHGDEEYVPVTVASSRSGAFAQAAQRYVHAWALALQQASDRRVRDALLEIDHVEVRGSDLAGKVVLVGPTHPLRFLWMTRFRERALRWIRNAETDEEMRDLAAAMARIPPQSLPHITARGARPYRFLDDLTLGWGAWSLPELQDPRAVSLALRDALGLRPVGIDALQADAILLRIKRYLVSHPYVRHLILNFVQPGDASIVLSLLLALQQDAKFSELRYTIRLFGAGAESPELGRALDEFMQGEAAQGAGARDAAEAFLSAGDDPLAPKLTYSKHPLSLLADGSTRFPAHVTCFIDWFSTSIVPAPQPVDQHRSVRGGGLLFDPVISYRAGLEDADPQWDEYLGIPTESDDVMLQAYEAVQASVAASLGGGPKTLPVTRLTLDRVSRTVLDSVHRHSDWVVVVDRVFTDDFLDSQNEEGEMSRYLLDYVTPDLLGSDRHVLVSTRLRAELGLLLKPAAETYGLELGQEDESALLSSLQVLGAGLPLKLLQNRNAAAEALSLAFAGMFLETSGYLRHAIALPLDAHQDLINEALEARVDDVTRLRTDIAIIQLHPDERSIDVHLVEVKARLSLPPKVPAELIEHIDAQLTSSLAVLRDRLFALNIRQGGDSLPAALHVRRLSLLLSRYLDRAIRFGFVPSDEVKAIRHFIDSLETPFKARFSKHALLFDMSGDPTGEPESFSGVNVMRVGRSRILDLLRGRVTRQQTQLASGATELASVFSDHEPADTVQIPATMTEAEEATVPEGAGDIASVPQEAPAGASDTPTAEGPDLESVVLLGMTQRSAQFGIFAEMNDTGEPAAIDLDGTNVVSVFGVQGSGKSYTVGALLEAALIQEPTLHRLPTPLAGVVFHYSKDQSYRPEFASMAAPNTDPALLARFAESGITAQGVQDVVILTPEGTLDVRRREFPSMQVEPLVLGSDELQINDWKLLMGLEGGDQMYSRAMTALFRKIRGNVSLERLSAEIRASSLSEAQKNIASMRLTFLEGFVSDEGNISTWVRPGTLVIVDLRDELVEQEEALALFMVLLNRITQVSLDDRPFNKLIVFDEAHKYMGNTRLTNAIVETIREMRHRGTSVVIASQNPPSVPKEIIELSSVVMAHRFSSPAWLQHVKKVNSAFDDIRASQLSRLRSGEAYAWASGNPRFRRPQLIRVRPRLTLHGGDTRRATEQ